MQKTIRLFLFFLLLAGAANAQPYHNEWIPFAGGQDYSSQQYFRISIWKEGVYRIGYNDMQNAGVPVSAWFDPNRFQIFTSGAEQFIRVKDANNDNLFGPGDYVEFYGNKASGKLDTELYDDPEYQPNPRFNLFNDTAAYFLTYNPFSTNNRRMVLETDVNYSGYTAEASYVKEEFSQFTDVYNIGYRDYNKIADNSYGQGEGYYSSEYPSGSSLGPTFNIKNFLSSAGTPALEVVMAGANANDHPIEITGGGTPMITQTTYAYDMWKFNVNATNLPASGSYAVQLVPQVDVNMPSNPNYVQLGYVRLRYPRNFDFSGESLPQTMFVSGAAAKAYVQLDGITAASPLLYVIGNDTIKQVSLTQASGKVHGLIPVGSGEQHCYLIDNSQVFALSGNALLQSVNTDTDPAHYGRFHNYLTAGSSADFLMVANKNLWSSAQQYAAYKNTTGHTVLLADVNELYDQFSWGVRKSPQAIRSFADFMIDHNPGVPKFLFMLGKSVMSCNARSGNAYAINLVPTYGEPASDLMFTSHLNSAIFKPELATGRLAAQNNADVLAYLDKVTAFDANQFALPADWMKNVLHFGGGTNSGEQETLSSKLAIYRGIVEDTLFGGKVSTFLKSSTAPIQINQSQYLQSMIDSGCSMMTFYGHAAGTSFDIATDDPENYHNKDRYPLVLALSCYVGDIHSESRLLNERFILTPEKGAIAFMAVPDKGIIESLDDYAVPFHQHLFQKDYGKSIGESMQNTVAEIVLPDFNRKSVCMNMTLHGDPSLVLNQYQQPDYEVKAAGISYEPAVITTELDSFTVKVAVANLGRNTSQSMHVLLSRIFPDGITKKDTIVQVPYITYKDTVAFKLPVDFKKGSGLNRFDVTVDVYDEVPEIDDLQNNTAHSVLQINSTDINPVYPDEYAIVPNANVTLKATTADLFAAPRSYRFELDTTPFFNSPKFLTSTIHQATGIVQWVVPVACDSNTAYFWRIANDSIMSADTSISKKFQWKVSSFLFKPGKTGWSQAHYYQFAKSSLSNMLMVDTTRLFRYILSEYSLVMTHIGNRPSFDINSINIDYGGCAPVPQIAVAVLDSIDFLNAWAADSCERYFGNYNYYNCYTGQGCNRSRADRYFLFNSADSVQMDSLASMLQNGIPDGDYLMSWNVFPINYASIKASAKNAYANLGVTQMANLDNTKKFMFFMRKGQPQTLIYQEGHYPDSTLRINYQLVRDWDKGYVTSSVVGPATHWNQLHWSYSHLEANSPDSISLQVVGITPNNQEVVLYSNLNSLQDQDLSSIDAAQYPYLKLKAYTEDSQFRTPPQLDRWQIYYDPVPEGALNTKYYSFVSDTVQEGDHVTLSMAFENISDVKMDTLLVDYYLYDQNNVRHAISSVRTNRDLPPGDTLMTQVSFGTRGYLGVINLWIEANPRNDQPEQAHFNNLTSLKFNVMRDITNPLLDVTFDGVHILNGDIVSARPAIQIRLKDENRFIALNDTSDYRVSLTDPSGQSRYVHFEKSSGVTTSADLLRWSPAVLPDNSFTMDYNPSLLTDGVYELNVQATDESGNLSGQNDYRIQFEIVNQSSITEVVNYPNPFSTSTRFVFTLTGADVPSAMLIQIMTVTGKIVREITRDELGPIHIGKNITEFAWDGKDNFGDQLANGVYLYRVITQINGSNVDKRSTDLDKYFKRGWGKMYLLR